MLLAGGDEPAEALSGLQRITIVSALPFVLVMLLMCFALVKDLRRDPLALRRRLADSVVERSIRSGVEQHGGVQFDLVTNTNATNGSSEGEPGSGGDTASPTDPK
jgi:choline-glycine betaine transporter